MEIIHGNPPNIEELRKHFPIQESTVFAYADKLYVPAGDPVPAHLMAHEATHGRQQVSYPGGVDAWYQRYIEDIEFRLSQELEAYWEQYRFIKADPELRPKRHSLLEVLARDLSSPLYGGIINRPEAMRLIMRKGNPSKP